MINQKEEMQWATLKNIAKDLHLPVLEAFWDVQVLYEGKVIQDIHQRSHSWVRNAYNVMMSQLAGLNHSSTVAFGAGSLVNRNTSGGTISGLKPHSISNYPSSDPEAASYCYRGAAGVDTLGIVVGSGTANEDFEGYALGSKIANGTGDGQLTYVEGGTPVKSYASLTFSGLHERYFNNNSTVSCVVSEIAIYTPGNNGTYMVVRDLLSSYATVASTGQLKASYTINLVYPS